jgi:ATP-dependent RNA helicase SUPV3L1/SUV3
MLKGSPPPAQRARGVTAVLGPTNTGKTHYAIERMLGHGGGIIGLPLRLLAREVYGRLIERVGERMVALVTGEEKIKPKDARYTVATVEAMPRGGDPPFVAIDEIQLAADNDRGHVFTDAMLNRRGAAETLLIGSLTMKPLIEQLVPGCGIVTRPRLSRLAFAGERKITRLPPRSAIVAFSVEDVYAIAELIRRQRGGAAVVMGSLSPRTRNAQVALFQSGDVDYVVATDAIGMGLNLDIDHVAFAANRKFDGHRFRLLSPSEMAQIAGRAGRNMRDGTFGSSGRCPPFEEEMIERLENHHFEPTRSINWRNPALDFSSLRALQLSLQTSPDEAGVVRAPVADDELLFELLATRPDIRDRAARREGVERLWDVCALPDYRKVGAHGHAELVSAIFHHLIDGGRLPPDWLSTQIAMCDRTDGDIETISGRVAQIRTWTYCANRPDWTADPEYWQSRTRAVEDRLSDALHEKLAARFVDRRTSVLMRRLRENAMLEAEVTAAGDVVVEGQHVGRLAGFRFTADSAAVDSPEAKALRAAAARALSGEIDLKAQKLGASADDQFTLAIDGAIRWQGEAVGRLVAGEKLLEPRALLLADEQLAGGARESVETRLGLWLRNHVVRLLGPLLHLEAGEGVSGLGRGIAYRLAEALGVLERSAVSKDVKALDQTQRAELRKHGVRFGAFHIYVPQLLKPAARALAAQLHLLKTGEDGAGLDDVAHLAASGRTSFPADAKIARDLYRVLGFRVCGPRAVRVDILERLADLIRPAIAFRPGVTPGEPPAGAWEGEAFVVSGPMTSLVGCAGEDFAALLRSLGYRSETQPARTEPWPVIEAPRTPIAQPPADAEAPAAAAPDAAAQGEAEPGETAPAPTAYAEDPLPPERAEQDPHADEPAAPDDAEAAVAAHAELAHEEPAGQDQGYVEPAIDIVSAEATIAEAVRVETVLVETTSGEPAPTAEAGAADAASPAEPAMIEVWRLARFERPERPQRRPFRPRGDRPGEARDGAAAPGDQRAGRRGFGSGQPAGDRPPRREGGFAGARPHQGERRRDDRGPDDRRHQERRQDSPRQDSPRQDSPRHDQPRADAASPGADAAPRRDPSTGQGAPHRHAPRSEAGPPPQRADGPRRDDRRGDRRKDAPPQTFQSGPKRDARQPDPDSPFAALAALKARLEQK